MSSSTKQKNWGRLPEGIRRRGGKFFVDVSLDGVRKTATCDTIDEAKDKRQDLYRSLRAGEETPNLTRGIRLGEAIALTFQTPAKHGWRGSKSEGAANKNTAFLLDHFGKNKLLGSITNEDIADFSQAMVDRGNSGATVNRKLAALSKVMTLAMRRGRIQSKPLFDRHEESKGRIRWLKPKEEEVALRLITQWSQQDFWDVFVVLTDTGLRCGELWSLERQDVNVEQKFLTVWEHKNKTGVTRSVPMTLRVREVMVRRVKEPSSSDDTDVDLVFPFDNSWLRVKWSRLRGQMGLKKDPQFVPHMLRHTCASRLVQNGVQLQVVKEWLGHKGLTMTMRYAHLAPTQLLTAMKVLETVKALEPAE